MPATGRGDLVEGLIDRFGYTIRGQLGGSRRGSGPSELFRVACVSMLTGSKNHEWQSIAATRALFEDGYGSAERLAATSWKHRLHTLHEVGLERSPERRAILLGGLADAVRDRYEGDLTKLREQGGRDPAGERDLLKRLKGFDDDAVDIFFREVQLEWDELYPFAGRRVRRAARRLGLPDDPTSLAGLSGRTRFPRLAAALSHVDSADAYAALGSGQGSGLVIDLEARSAASPRAS